MTNATQKRVQHIKKTQKAIYAKSTLKELRNLDKRKLALAKRALKRHTQEMKKNEKRVKYYTATVEAYNGVINETTF